MIFILKSAKPCKGISPPAACNFRDVLLILKMPCGHTIWLRLCPVQAKADYSKDKLKTIVVPLCTKCTSLQARIFYFSVSTKQSKSTPQPKTKARSGTTAQYIAKLVSGINLFFHYTGEKPGCTQQHNVIIILWSNFCFGVKHENWNIFQKYITL